MGHIAPPGYAYGQLERAVRAAASAKDSAARRRARAKASQWQEVLAGMADGSLWIGSRVPVAGTPEWVTLEVAHGGFATGRFTTPEEVATLITFLASGCAANITGANYLIDGGLIKTT